MIDNILPWLDVIPINRIIGSERLKELVKPLSKPVTALCLRPVNIAGNAITLAKAAEQLMKPGVGFCFFGPYFLPGCVRDDFDFGPVLLFSTSVLKGVITNLPEYRYAAFYAVWLGATMHHQVYAIPPESGLRIIETNSPDKSGISHFDYVDPRNKDVQLEMEQVITSYLRYKGALLQGTPAPTTFIPGNFPVEASVIIPVKNRTRTITDALESALAQLTEKPYNVVVVDNHSTDGTTEKIKEIATKDKRLIHIIPETNDLQIGGCWNLAANDPRCGRFCIQLDSDDIYSSPNTVQTILDTFYREECGMVVGSYTLTDFNLQTIPPGLIDHREWTEKNGRNNLLRVNGIGAPRAFYTPLLRKHPAPDVSYGEDYALALVFSRLYRIGRVFESLYFCRRWEDNTDANPDPELKIKQNHYKDELRTQELKERIELKFIQA